MSGLTPVSFQKGREYASRLSPVRVPGRHSERYWRPEEEDVLRRCYPEGGAQACAAQLAKLGTPRRTTHQIYAHANTLGIKLARAHDMQRRSWAHLLTPEMDARIREEWADLKGRGAVQSLADRLDVPRERLSARALELGLTSPHQKEPAWTAAEESMLPTLPLHDLRKSARIMREHGFVRTPTAIGIKAKRLAISRRRRDAFTATRAAGLLGMDSKTVSGWCIDGSLPATRGGTERLPQQGGDFWIITPPDLRQFIIDHIDRIDIRKVDKLAFVDLLVSAPSSPAPAPRASLSMADVVVAAALVPASDRKASASPRRRPRSALGKRPLSEILAEAEQMALAKGICAR